MDVALWIAGEVPESAVGFSCRNRANAVHDSHDCYAPERHHHAHQSEHVPNAKGDIGVRAYGQKAHLEANYSGKVFIRGVEDGYAGGDSKTLYADGMKANVDTFHQSIMNGSYSNPTLEPSVNSTLASLLGRETALRGRKLTWDELLKDTQRLHPDLTGLKA